MTTTTTTTTTTGTRGLRAILRAEAARARAATLEREFVAAYQAARPASRASSLITIERHTSCVHVERCLVCGDTHSESARWPTTAHMAAWRHKHRHHSAAALRARLAELRREAAERALWRRYARPARAADQRAVRAAAGLPALGPIPGEYRSRAMAVLARRGSGLARVVVEVEGRDGRRYSGRAQCRWVELGAVLEVRQ